MAPRWTTLVTFCWLWSSSHSSRLQHQMPEWWLCHQQPIVLPPRLTLPTSRGNVDMTAWSNTAALSCTMYVCRVTVCVSSLCWTRFGWTVAPVLSCTSWVSSTLSYHVLQWWTVEVYVPWRKCTILLNSWTYVDLNGCCSAKKTAWQRDHCLCPSSWNCELICLHYNLWSIIYWPEIRHAQRTNTAVVVSYMCML